jgi:hypothetical protein
MHCNAEAVNNEVIINITSEAKRIGHVDTKLFCARWLHHAFDKRASLNWNPILVMLHYDCARVLPEIIEKLLLDGGSFFIVAYLSLKFYSDR